jgi:hypothetical protein
MSRKELWAQILVHFPTYPESRTAVSGGILTKPEFGELHKRAFQRLYLRHWLWFDWVRDFRPAR